MSKDGGWFKIYRDIFDHEIGSDDWLFRLFAWCIKSANTKPQVWKGELIPRGSFITGRNVASERLHVSPSKFHRGVQRLVKLGSITAKANSNWTTITICNYETYQSRAEKSEQAADKQRTADEQPSDSERTQLEEFNNTRNQEYKKVTLAADAACETSPDLLDWLGWWNRLHSEKLVFAGVDAAKPSAGITAGWNRVKRSSALRKLLSDREAVEAAIRGSKFVQGAPWFTLAKLFGGKNNTGEVIAEKLLEGGFRDKAAGASRSSDPTGNQALLQRRLETLRDESEVLDGEIV
jgi:hypothetical protein